MKEVITEILAAEKHAESLLAEARNQAQARRQDIDKEFSEKIAAARQKAQDIIARTAETARTESGQARKELIAVSLEKDKSAIEKISGRIDTIAGKIVDLLIKTDTDQGI